MSGVDVLVVGVDSTGGWRAATDELADSLRRAGARVERVGPGPLRRVRTFALTDYVEARAARRVGRQAIATHNPTAIVYCSINAALLWPRPGAVYLDSIAAENRPGRHGFWQRQVERRRLQQAPLVLAWSERSLQALRGPHAQMFVTSPPVSIAAHPDKDIDAITYAGDPVKRRLDVVLDAWRRARREHETLVVTGTDQVEPTAGVDVAGRLAPEAFRALLGRSKLFLAAPRREDYGIAALEALACGCLLVTTPSPGPYPGLELARRLDPRLVAADLAQPIRVALDEPAPDYAARAAQLLQPFTREAFDVTVANEVLPRLLRT